MGYRTLRIRLLDTAQPRAVLGVLGGPMINKLLKLVPEGVVVAALMQPSGFIPERPDRFYKTNIKAWGHSLCQKRPEITMAMVHEFLTRIYTDHAGFAFTVSRDCVGLVKTPLLIAPDNMPVHPYGVAIEVANLFPNSEVTIFPSTSTLTELQAMRAASSSSTSSRDVRKPKRRLN